jgi:hypothetical protein
MVPASCTDKLQPLDQTINKKYKEELKKEFQMWGFADIVAKKLSHGLYQGFHDTLLAI